MLIALDLFMLIALDLSATSVAAFFDLGGFEAPQLAPALLLASRIAPGYERYRRL